MTWEEIRPAAESILGEGCGAMTLDDLERIASKAGKTASDLVKEIEERLQRGDR